MSEALQSAAETLPLSEMSDYSAGLSDLVRGIGADLAQSAVWQELTSKNLWLANC